MKLFQQASWGIMALVSASMSWCQVGAFLAPSRPPVLIADEKLVTTARTRQAPHNSRAVRPYTVGNLAAGKEEDKSDAGEEQEPMDLDLSQMFEVINHCSCVQATLLHDPVTENLKSCDHPSSSHELTSSDRMLYIRPQPIRSGFGPKSPFISKGVMKTIDERGISCHPRKSPACVMRFLWYGRVTLVCPTSEYKSRCSSLVVCK